MGRGVGLAQWSAFLPPHRKAPTSQLNSAWTRPSLSIFRIWPPPECGTAGTSLQGSYPWTHGCMRRCIAGRTYDRTQSEYEQIYKARCTEGIAKCLLTLPPGSLSSFSPSITIWFTNKFTLASWASIKWILYNYLYWIKQNNPSKWAGHNRKLLWRMVGCASLS